MKFPSRYTFGFEFYYAKSFYYALMGMINHILTNQNFISFYFLNIYYLEFLNVIYYFLNLINLEKWGSSLLKQADVQAQ